MLVRILCFFLFFVSAVWSFDISDYGVVIGGSYAKISGEHISDMRMYVNSLEFEEKVLPFRDGVSADADPSGIFGPVFGAFVRMNFNDWLYLRTDLYYIWKGASYEKKLDTLDTYGGREALDLVYEIAKNKSMEDQVIPGSRRIEYNHAYLELPILFGVNIVEALSVYGGLNISYLLHSSFTLYITEGRFISEEGKPLSFGKKNFNDFKLSTNSIDIGYTIGLNYILSDQLQLGFRWAPSVKNFIDLPSKPKLKHNSLQLVLSLNFNPY
ncbi:MAG: PorT family protein [Fibrobacter sp.]|nr:PorT family protein [Fibrobacter sp.]